MTQFFLMHFVVFSIQAAALFSCPSHICFPTVLFVWISACLIYSLWICELYTPHNQSIFCFHTLQLISACQKDNLCWIYLLCSLRPGRWVLALWSCCTDYDPASASAWWECSWLFSPILRPIIGKYSAWTTRIFSFGFLAPPSLSGGLLW